MLGAFIIGGGDFFFGRPFMLGAGILAFFYHVVSFHTRPDQKPRQVCLLKKKFEKQMVTQKESLWGRDLVFKKKLFCTFLWSHRNKNGIVPKLILSHAKSKNRSRCKYIYFFLLMTCNAPAPFTEKQHHIIMLPPPLLH